MMGLLALLRPSLRCVSPPGPAHPLPEQTVLHIHALHRLQLGPLCPSPLKNERGDEEHGAEQGMSLGQGRGICHGNLAGPLAWLQLWGLHTGWT